jgi:hypothetical protein
MNLSPLPMKNNRSNKCNFPFYTPSPYTIASFVAAISSASTSAVNRA